jgi:hypothetical protein
LNSYELDFYVHNLQTTFTFPLAGGRPGWGLNPGFIQYSTPTSILGFSVLRSSTACILAGVPLQGGGGQFCDWIEFILTCPAPASTAFIDAGNVRAVKIIMAI